jgi:hypothetical protein
MGSDAVEFGDRLGGQMKIRSGDVLANLAKMSQLIDQLPMQVFLDPSDRELHLDWDRATAGVVGGLRAVGGAASKTRTWRRWSVSSLAPQRSVPDAADPRPRRASPGRHESHAAPTGRRAAPAPRKARPPRNRRTAAHHLPRRLRDGTPPGRRALLNSIAVTAERDAATADNDIVG